MGNKNPESEEEEEVEEEEGLEKLSTSSSATSSILSAVSAESSLFSELSITSSVGSGEIPTMTEILPAAKEMMMNRCVGRRKGATWGVSSVIGRRREMEDDVAVVPGFLNCSCRHVGGCVGSGDASPVHFFGVFDGHGGNQVAKFCAERMHEVVADEWERENMTKSKWQKKWESTFSSSFERADDEALTKGEASNMVGSTAVVVVLSSCQIIVANCGDSRAILCRGIETIPLTVDQKPDREDELERIESGGGKVINWNGARVFGVLAMSRAIGDRYLRPWIIPVPEITFTTRTNEDECIIVASDGLWDVMTNNEVGDMARRLLRRRRKCMSDDELSPAQAVSNILTEIAYGRNSSDNISIIVVDLKPKTKLPQRR